MVWMEWRRDLWTVKHEVDCRFVVFTTLQTLCKCELSALVRNHRGMEGRRDAGGVLLLYISRAREYFVHACLM